MLNIIEEKNYITTSIEAKKAFNKKPHLIIKNFSPSRNKRNLPQNENNIYQKPSANMKSNDERCGNPYLGNPSLCPDQ